MPAYRIVRKQAFDKDVAKATGRDPIFAERVEKRIAKLGERPKHHGYHAGGRIRCNWVAGIGDWAIIYQVDDTGGRVTFLRFVSLDNL